MEVTKDFSTRHWKIHEVAKAGDKATKTVFYTTDSTSGSVLPLIHSYEPTRPD